MVAALGNVSACYSVRDDHWGERIDSEQVWRERLIAATSVLELRPRLLELHESCLNAALDDWEQQQSGARNAEASDSRLGRLAEARAVAELARQREANSMVKPVLTSWSERWEVRVEQSLTSAQVLPTDARHCVLLRMRTSLSRRRHPDLPYHAANLRRHRLAVVSARGGAARGDAGR